MTKTYEDLLVSIDGAVATITVKRPATLNAIRTETGDELLDALRALADDPKVVAVILSGDGRAFGAGMDFQTIDFSEDLELDKILAHFSPLIEEMRASRLIIVSAVQGACVGGSSGIALAADFVICAESAFFWQSFVEISLVPDAGNSFVFSSVAGRMRAAEALLLGDRVPAERMKEWGLVREVVADDELMKSARELAEKIASRNPQSLARTKKLIRLATDSGLTRQLEHESIHQTAMGEAPEFRDAVTRFAK